MTRSPFPVGHVRATAPLPLLFLLWVAPTTGQVLRGTVLEQETSRPLDGVVVTLLMESGDSVTTAISNERGVFGMIAPRAGRYRLRAQRLGFVSSTNSVVDLDVGLEVTVTLTMSTSAIPLEPLRVESRSIPLNPQFADLQERMKQGFGRFITRDDIEHRPAATVPDLLRNIPGAHVDGTGHGDIVVQLRPRPANQDIPVPDTSAGPMAQRLGAYMTSNQCPVKLYVDGAPWIRDHQVRDSGNALLAMERNAEFMALHGSEIEVIEVYNGPASVPSIYGGSDAECGVIAVWLRRTHDQAVFGPRGSPPPPTGIFAVPRVIVGLSIQQLSGANAPERGVAIEAAAQWSITGGIGIGLHLRRSGHNLPVAAIDELTSTLSNTEYVLPPRSRALAVWTAGVEPRLQLRPASRVRPVLGARLEFAQRRFDLQSANVGNREIPVISYGWGVGLSAGVEAALTRRLSGYAAVGQEWLSFGSYREIERPWNETAATWRATSLRLGVAYDFLR